MNKPRHNNKQLIFTDQENTIAEQSRKIEQILTQNTSGLIDLMKHQVSSISTKLLGKNLIPRSVHESALTTTGVSDRDKAAQLVSCVTECVKRSLQKFNDFICALKEDPYYEDIVEKLVSESSHVTAILGRQRVDSHHSKITLILMLIDSNGTII